MNKTGVRFSPDPLSLKEQDCINKHMKKNYVYKITNTLNGKWYIGKRQWHGPISEDKYMGSGSIIKNAIAKHGVQYFKKEILAIFDNDEDASEFEFNSISSDDVKNPNCYNCRRGGNGGWDHINLSEEKYQICHRGGKNNMAKHGNPFDKFTPEKRSEISKKSAKSRKDNGTIVRFKKSKGSASGSKNSMYGKIWCVKSDAVSLDDRRPFKKNEIPKEYISCQEWKIKNTPKPTNTNAGRSWYNNGIESRLFLEKDVPSGFKKGRKTISGPVAQLVRAVTS